MPTDIGWTDEVWNVTRGCRRVSAGCEHCYAERTANRFSGPGQPYEGLVKLTTAGPRWTGKGRFVAEKLADPLRWRKPRRVFVDSMSDLFFEAFDNEQIAAVFGVMAACPLHTFQILTKRPQRMREWFEWARLNGIVGPDGFYDCTYLNHLASKAGLDSIGSDPWLEHCEDTEDTTAGWPLPNVHLGVSAENQDAFDERWPDLFACPAAVHWFSCEPLLGPIDMTHALAAAHERKLWVVDGCESGSGARPARPEWFGLLESQCRAAGVPYWHKQEMIAGHLVHDFPGRQEFPR